MQPGTGPGAGDGLLTGFNLTGKDNGGMCRNELAAQAYPFPWKPNAWAKYAHVDLIEPSEVGVPLPLATKARVWVSDDQGASVTAPADYDLGLRSPVAPFMVDPARTYTVFVQPLGGSINLGVEPRSEPQRPPQ
jgi:hypothetical protein